jgi:hypothetical protein
MPKAEERRRGGVIRYRTIKRGGKTITIAVVPKAGKRGGHTVAGKPRTPKKGK